MQIGFSDKCQERVDTFSQKVDDLLNGRLSDIVMNIVLLLASRHAALPMEVDEVDTDKSACEGR